jgi:hypothetical protein
MNPAAPSLSAAERELFLSSARSAQVVLLTGKSCQ